MASTPPETSSDHHAIVKRAVMRLSGLQSETDASENTVDLVNYLIDSGIRDEDELVELAEIANGKRYDPANGSFL